MSPPKGTRPLPEIPRTRMLTIVAQDPTIRRKGKILTAEVEVPAEALAGGPWGHRVQIIDYDASTGTLYRPQARSAHALVKLKYRDPFRKPSKAMILNNPRFHAQNVYAIVMRILARFEYALGRRVSWGFFSHQLKVAPHAFADANAFYSEKDEALLFGYFPGSDGNMVFSCLSHDVIAHEATHALVDGLRERFTDPSSPDQAAFHEGFADVVALLSVFSLPAIVAKLIDLDATGARHAVDEDSTLIAQSRLTPRALKKSILFGLAEQMGSETSGIRGRPLRQSLQLTASPKHYHDDPKYLEPHYRGEILVAAVLDAFVNVWSERIEDLGAIRDDLFDRNRVVEEGAVAADRLLTMSIRALDYTPPVHLEFSDFLSALLTADIEIQANDTKYQFRNKLRESFLRFGVVPAAKGTAEEPGVWASCSGVRFSTHRTHFESMLREPDEVFWFVWENRKALGIHEGAFGRILSVRPCQRIASDGFSLRETVAEFYQVIRISAAELGRMGLKAPEGMPESEIIPIYGGNTIVFDEYGQPKYNIHNSITNPARQQRRLDYLWKYGHFSRKATSQKFANMHLRRAMAASIEPDDREAW